MQAQNFAALWSEPLTQVAVSDLESLPLSSGTKTFLATIGLPEDAAPFLSFELEDGVIPVAEQWDLPPEFKGYWSIGSTGSGDPVCVKENDEVVHLNHDNNFEEIFINSSINHLAECLLIYKQQIETLDDGYLDDLPEAWKQQTWHLLCGIDETLTQRENFWAEELELEEK